MTSNSLTKETQGAWIIHHGRKLAMDATGAAEFPAIDEASKAATLLAKLSEGNQTTLALAEVKAVAVASGINPRHELNGLLAELGKKRLLDVSASEISILGFTQRGALAHASDLFEDAEPSPYERSSIALAELSSRAPIQRKLAKEYLSDTCKLTKGDTVDFLQKAEAINFVDSEGEGDEGLVFNGNLFRRDAAEKSAKVLTSLSDADQRLVQRAEAAIRTSGCLPFKAIESILGEALFEKLRAAGLYDVNLVINEAGHHGFITTPSAFHKFVDPMVDDSFDMAKALVAALSYGMHQRSSSQGKIRMLDALLRKLIRGNSVGPATAIGQDYRALEISRVVKLTPDSQFPNRYWMRLLKPEVGQLALQVLLTGDASGESLRLMPDVPMSGYVGPEETRSRARRQQSGLSKKGMRDVLEAVRTGGSI